MVELFSRLLSSAPAALELIGSAVIGVALYLQWGAPAALGWAGIACFGLSFTIESREKRGRKQ